MANIFFDTIGLANSTSDPSSVVAGNVYYNLTTKCPRYYDGTSWHSLSPAQVMGFALSDETTALTTGTAKVTFRAPFAMNLLSIPRASLSTASSSGLVTVDINEAGSSIFSTLLTIDATETTSTTATNIAVLSDTFIADDAIVTFDIDAAGTGAKGLKVFLYYERA